MHIEVRGQLGGVSSLFLPCGSQGLTSGSKDWWKAPYPLNHHTGLVAHTHVVSTFDGLSLEAWIDILWWNYQVGVVLS